MAGSIWRTGWRVHESGEKSGGVGAGGNGICGDVGPELGQSEGGRNEEYARPVSGSSLDHKSLEKVHGVPDGLFVNHH